MSGAPRWRRRRPGRRASREDVLAGFTVAVVGIPQAIAYAELAGLPANRGLLTAGVAAILGAAFGSSPSLQTGVTALASLLTLGVLADRAGVGTPHYIALAGLLAVEVGVVRLLLGLRRWGRISYILSQPVIVGLSTGAGVTIIASQVGAVLGIDRQAANPIVDAALALGRAGEAEPVALLSAATVLAALLVLPRLHRRIPAPLVALLAGGALATVLGGVDTVSLERPVLGVSWGELAPGDPFALLVPAGVLALIGFSEASAIARRYAAADRYEWDADRELLGQGAASLGAGLVGGFPISGSFARTALARLAGARTRAAAVISGVVVLLVVPLVPWVPPIPRPALAAVVLAAGVSLIDLAGMRRLFDFARLQFGVGLVTFVATLALSPRVDYAVLAGIAVAAAVHLFREEQINLRREQVGDTVRVHVQGVIFFASAPRVVDALANSVGAAGAVRRVELNLRGAGRVDVSGAIAIADALRDLAEAGFEVAVVEVPTHARKIVQRLLGDRLELPAGEVAPPRRSPD